MREKRVMKIKRGLMKRAKKLRLGAKRTGAYVYGTLRRIVGNGPYSKTILKVLHSPIEAYSRGKRIPDLYEALLIRFGSGELGIMIGWRNRNGELIQTPGAWTLDSLKGVSDSIAIDYGQGWTVRGMHGAIAEAKSDASYRIRDLKGNPMRSSFDKPTFGPGQAEYRRVDTTTMAGMKEAERLQRAGWYQAQVTPFSTTYYRRKIRKNPPMYAHGMMAHRTHGLSLKQMMKLYRLVSSGNPKAVMYARRTLGIPMSESLSQVKAVVYHHVMDLRGKI
jgi:hypothetical protein